MEALPQFEDCAYLFSIDGRHAFSNFYNEKRRLDKRSGVKHWTHHDLRRTMRTRLSGLKVLPEVAERVIGHTIGGVRAHYDYALYREPKRAALFSVGIRTAAHRRTYANRRRKRRHAQVQEGSVKDRKFKFSTNITREKLYENIEQTFRRHYERDGNPIHAYVMLLWALRAKQLPPAWCASALMPALSNLAALIYQDRVEDKDMVQALGLKPKSGRSLFGRARQSYLSAAVADFVDRWPKGAGEEIALRYISKPKQRASQRDDWPYDGTDAQKRTLKRYVRLGRSIRSDSRAKGAKGRKVQNHRE